MSPAEIVKQVNKYKNTIRNLNTQLANSNQHIERLIQEKNNLVNLTLEKDKIIKENNEIIRTLNAELENKNQENNEIIRNLNKQLANKNQENNNKPFKIIFS